MFHWLLINSVTCPPLGDQDAMSSYNDDPERTEVGPSLGRKIAIYAQMEQQIDHIRRNDEEDEFSEHATRLKEMVRNCYIFAANSLELFE